MHETFRNFTFKLIILLSLASCGACSSSKAKANEVVENLGAKPIAMRNDADKTVAQRNKPDTKSEVSTDSVAGNYEYNTIKNGEGYVNSLEVEDKGAGKLRVSLSGSYVYKANGAETFHEASGEGEARLSGNTAVVDLTDENDGNCRVTVVFAANKATVKVPDACYFNVVLNGIYKKGKLNVTDKREILSNEAKSTDVAFEDLADFINDFDKHRLGERFVIYDVPIAKIDGVWRADADGKKDYEGLFLMDFRNGGADGSGAFLASKALVRDVQGNGNSKTATLRVTAVLVEATSDNVYRSVFAIKIEGLNKNGELIWSAEGDKPTKLTYRN